MQAIRYHETGGPDVLRLDEIPVPTPGPGQVRIRVGAVGLNFYETLQRRGNYRVAPALPFTPGGEAAGTIDALGPDVPENRAAGIAVGARVCALTGSGAYAAYVVAPAGSVFPLSDHIDIVHGAAIALQGLTAYGVLHLSGRLRPGETVLVHAAAGGVGTLAVQLAKLGGAGLIIGTAGGPAKLPLVRELGADHAIDYRDTADLAADVKKAAGDHGVDVVLDSVGAATFPTSLAVLARFGRLVTFGGASGQAAPVPPGRLIAECQSISGFMLGAALSDEAFAQRAVRDLFGAVADGRIRLVIGPRFPLAEAAAAQRALESRETTGKVVLVVDDRA